MRVSRNAERLGCLVNPFLGLETMDKELIAGIRNKLTVPKTALDLLSQGKDVPKGFIGMAEKDLGEAVRMLEQDKKCRISLWGKTRKLLEVGFKWIFPVIIAFIVLVLQWCPQLKVSGISGGFSDTGKIYFYVRNVGTIPAHFIKGGFIITSNVEEKPQQAKNVTVLLQKFFDTGKSVIFYTTGIDSVIPLIFLSNLNDLDKEAGHIFLSIYFKYPQFKVFGINLFWKTYEGVFQYAPSKSGEYIWVQSSQTMYPGLFTKTFKALRKKETIAVPRSVCLKNICKNAP